MENKRIKTWIHGTTGRMGKEIIELVSNAEGALEIIGGSGLSFVAKYTDGKMLEKPKDDLINLQSNADLFIDFTSSEGNKDLLGNFKANPALANKSLLIASTGLSKEQISQWKSLTKERELSILMAPNTSLGVYLTLMSALNIASILRGKDFDIEIIETHHRNKIDSPSGTAKFLGTEIAKKEGLTPVYNRTGKRQQDELGVVAMRGGSVFGEHEIKFLGDSEEISITHKALSRSLFAKGAIALGSWVYRKNPGFYGLLDIKLEEMVSKD